MAKKSAGVKYDRKTRQTAEEMYGEHARKTGRDVMEIFEERKERWTGGEKEAKAWSEWAKKQAKMKK